MTIYTRDPRAEPPEPLRKIITEFGPFEVRVHPWLPDGAWLIVQEVTDAETR